MQNRPVYPIGIVAEMLNVHPETIRSWERGGVCQPPQRRGGKRFYSEDDVIRLRFIKRMTEEGLNLTAIRHYLQIYPCWNMDDCPGCMHRAEAIGCGKPCWKEEGTYCQLSPETDIKNMCVKCELRGRQRTCIGPKAKISNN